MTIRRLRRRGLPLALIAGSLILLQASECKKGREFYIPVGLTGGVNDNTAPLITDFLPVPNLILNDVVVMATITDPQGSNGATPSGVDASSITAVGDDGADLAITTAGTNMYNADIAALGDGPHTINWTAVDLAGNTATGSQSFTVDRTDPVVTVTQMPSPTGMSDQPSVDLTYQFTLSDPHFGSATFGVFNCNTGAPWPEGTGGGQVEDQSRTYTEAGAQTATFRFFNGVPFDGPDAVAPYCFNGRADDAGVTKSGQPAPNFSEFSGRVDFTWKPPIGDFTVGLNQPPPGWLHDMPGVSSLECKVIRTTPARPGALFTATTTGPTEGGPSGVLTAQPVTGTLNANGEAQLQVRINRLGTYVNVVTVILGETGINRSATTTVTVTSAANTCPAIQSSIRFKRDVVALLPDDVRPLGLNPVAFRYVEPYGDPAVPRIGLIAEEVAEVFPEAVLLDAAGRPEAIDYRVLTGAVVEEVEARAAAATRAAIDRLARMVF